MKRTNCYKVVLLGETGVGKTSIGERLYYGRFREHIVSTVGSLFFKIMLNENFIFDLWDTAGQERYHSLAPLYYRGSSLCIIVFDISDRSSLDRAGRWLKELELYKTDQRKILIGNKIDIEVNNINNIKKDAEVISKRYNVKCIYTSAKTNIGFDTLTKGIIDIFNSILEKTSNLVEVDYEKNRDYCCR